MALENNSEQMPSRGLHLYVTNPKKLIIVKKNRLQLDEQHYLLTLNHLLFYLNIKPNFYEEKKRSSQALFISFCVVSKGGRKSQVF